MIVGLSVSNYRALHSVEGLPLAGFHVLVGPNASGKSTFLEVFDFIRDCLDEGPRQATANRAPEFRDLTFLRRGGPVSFVVWLELGKLPAGHGGLLRYHLVLDQDEDQGVRISAEELCCLPGGQLVPSLIPGLCTETQPAGRVRLVGKTARGTDFYSRENGDYQDTFTFGPERLALAMTPADEERYPTANAAKRFLLQGVRFLQLNSLRMRLPCPATAPAELMLDGSNLAKVVGRLLQPARGNGAPPEADALQRWVTYLRHALPDLQAVGWDRRAPDNAEYVVLHYRDGLACPSWLASDGTLRLLALTLPAFLPHSPCIYLVEEPENGVHPLALEVIVRALADIPQAQVLVATHSPLVVAQVGPKPLLCFAREAGGATITPGPHHPLLQGWDGSPDLATVFAAGILG